MRLTSASASLDCCASASSWRRRSRSNSLWGKIGWSTTSARMAIAGSRLALSTSSPICDVSLPAPPPRDVPRSPRSSSIWRAVLGLRSPVDRPHRQVGDAFLSDRIGEPARAGGDRQRDLRQIVSLDDEDLEPVIELRRLDVRRLEGPVCARIRFLGPIDGGSLGRSRCFGMEPEHDALVRVEPARGG